MDRRSIPLSLIAVAAGFIAASAVAGADAAPRLPLSDVAATARPGSATDSGVRLSLTPLAAPKDLRYVSAILTPSGMWTHTGWGLFATAHGASMDLWARGGWLRDPSALPGEIEAGFGWRRSNMSALVGYAQPAFASGAARSVSPSRRGLIGLSIAIRSR
ncbi:MAG: hypothetical protein ACHP84_10735 [Caulobacterales bacterium]